ncbi:MAG: autotransporter assembly complex protein TamA [Gammaproteobacteria bacterium]
MTNARRFARWALPALLAAAGPAFAGLEVSVDGVDGDERANVEARLSILGYANEGGDEEAEVRRLHRRAEADIRSALEACGYYGPRVRSRLSGKGRDWKASYAIDLGEPTLLGAVTLEVTGAGVEFPAIRQVVDDNKLTPGKRLQHAAYEGTKAALARAAFDNGFLDARFTAHALRVDPRQRRADVELRFDTGARYFFGDVSVVQERLDPEFIRRYIPIHTGAPFEPALLVQSQFALSDLGYFATVEVQPRKEQAVDQRVPITITTTPRPPQKYDIGPGYGTDTGARLSLGAEFRRLNDTGHRLRADLRLSEFKSSVGANYRIPLGTRAGENFGVATSYTDEQAGDGFSRRYDFAFTLSRTPGDWQRQLYLKHVYEQQFQPDTGLASAKLLLPGLTLTRGEFDDAIYARLGWSVFFDVHGGNEALVSDVSFLQARTLLRGALPLGERGRLLLRTELGATSMGALEDLPASQRFFAGGDLSVRGYDYQSLGPKDALTGLVIGGKYLSTYSVEAEYRVYGNWGAAVFLDAGGADNDANPPLAFGTGAGLRYRAPVGTLQLDLGHPLTGDEGGVRVHIGIRVGL